MPYIFYTEMELRRTHRGFVNTSVKAAENLLPRTAIVQLYIGLLKAMKKIQE